MLFQRITHQWREFTSVDANTHADAACSLQLAQAQSSGYAAHSGVSSASHCNLEYSFAPNPQVLLLVTSIETPGI